MTVFLANFRRYVLYYVVKGSKFVIRHDYRGREIPFHEYFWLKNTFLSPKYFFLLKSMINE